MDEHPLTVAALVESVRRRASADPLDQVEAALGVGEDLRSVADELVGYFIGEARREGTSWTAIGQRLGVSKQAARQRFGQQADVQSIGGLPLTPRLRRCLEAADGAARSDGAAEVGTHHQLIGLFEEGVAAATLEKLGQRVDAVRSATRSLFPPRSPSRVNPPRSLEARESLERAARLALGAGHNYVGTEHLLYSIAFDPGSRARRVLTHMELDLARLKKELSYSLEGRRKRRRARKWDGDQVCSFCGKRCRDDVRLVAGPGVWICEQCVDLCTEILASEQRAPTA